MEYHSGGSLPLLGRPRYCPGANANGGYLCETGHCCGETGCCTYYYELWWFWLLWTVLILFSCCCAYRHRRAKLRVQQQQRQRDISLLAYHGASSYPSSMLDLSFLASLKLPSYEEVAAQPSTPPPPYSSVFTAPRYPQPPRTADPHLLTQHGPLLHQPLSDGPSSLSSDNSSSCSCDSCCPSSPCSSSLSAPVTYETDTSHASTPSEATPLALDHVTMETINAAASRLELHRAHFSSERRKNSATVAIDIEATSPALKDNVTVAVVTGSASPLETTASPNSDTTLPVGITPPIKQQLDFKPMITSPTSPQNPSNVALPCIQSTEASRSNSPTTSPAVSLNLPRTFDSASSPTSPRQPRTFTLILDSTGNTCPDKNPSLVPISASPSTSQNPVLPKPVLSAVEETLTCTSQSESTSPVQKHVQTPDTNLSQASPASRTEHLIDTLPSPHKSATETHAHFDSPVATNCHHSFVPSSPSQGILNFSTKSAGELSDLDVISHEVAVYLDIESPNQTAEMSSQSPINALADPKNHQDIFSLSVSMETPGLTKSTEIAATNLTQTTENVDLQSFTESFGALVPSSLLPVAKAVSECVTSPPEASYSVQTSDKLVSSTEDPTQNNSQSQCEISTQATRSPQNSAPPNSGMTFDLDPVTHSPTSAQKQEPSQTPSTPSSDTSNPPEPTRASECCSELVPAPSDLDCSVISPSRDLSGQVAFDNLKELSCQAHIASSLHPNTANPSLVLDSCLNSNVLPKMAKLDISSASKIHTLSPTFDQDRELESTVNLSPPNLPQQQENDLKPSNSLQVASGSCFGLPQSPSLNLEHSFTTESMPDSNSSAPLGTDAYSFCPAITIQADPLSCATSPSSPCSIPSPTLPSPPVSMLLLDPLAAALHPSEKSGASSGHASSLSPSPRNTQSPPKQTLFSPCVDVFEPVNPNWEDEEDEEQQDDEDYDDDDMGADESQYRHRRLTGDSGIEVCRCRVEDEDDDDDEKLQSEEDGDKNGIGEKKFAGSALELHDSVDCPVRSQKSTGEELTLCNSASDTTPTSEDKVVISVETV